MGFHRRTLSSSNIARTAERSDDFNSFDVYMIGSDAYSFDDRFSQILWNYYSAEDSDSRRELWICILESKQFFVDLEKCLSVLEHPNNLPEHKESINRYVNLLRMKWGDDPYKMQIINFLHGSAKNDY